MIANRMKTHNRSISTSQLKALLLLHLRPIKVMVFDRSKNPHLVVGFALICFQRLSHINNSYPAMLLAEQPVHQRLTPKGPLVLL